jgi:hypothetical protein
VTYIEKAKAAVARTADIPAEDLFVVWFCKTLANWKALVSTDVVAGRYWEVTYNGAKGEAYVDSYVKTSNDVIPDGGDQ